MSADTHAEFVGLYGAFLRVVPDARAAWAADHEELERRRAEALKLCERMDALLADDAASASTP